ncbi:MAG TPA: cytochrome b/b6 domain-containing protein [Gammaproteobacteria bacterium]|nr:cytochrome b/b6 domain-containing protein [Gammaproteobacteria bacterium]
MQDRIVRHALPDRLIHWIIAVCTLVLLATAFLPILGIEFAWVAIHWWTGLVLIAAVVVHIARSLVAKRLSRIWIRSRDLRDALRIARVNLRLESGPLPKSGKYSVAQKLIHLAFAVVVLAASASGAILMVKVDTPFWERDPYWLSDETWGVVNVVHGLSALLLITMVMLHVYFALRPEKLMFLRAMVLGWITGREFDRVHDPGRWRVKE